MFNLIISIMSIALVVVLAGAGAYYGGQAFSGASEDAQGSALSNQAQQIQAASALRQATSGRVATSIAQLVPDFLASAPKLSLTNTRTSPDDNGLDWSIVKVGTALTGGETSVDEEILGKGSVWAIASFADDDADESADLGSDEKPDSLSDSQCEEINTNGNGVIKCDDNFTLAADGSSISAVTTSGSENTSTNTVRIRL